MIANAYAITALGDNNEIIPIIVTGQYNAGIFQHSERSSIVSKTKLVAQIINIDINRISDGHRQSPFKPVAGNPSVNKFIQTMYQAFLILLFVVRVKPEPKTFQHEYYVSRQSRDNTEPVQTGYVISRMDNKPASFQSLANHASASASLQDGTVKAHSVIGNIQPIVSDTEHHSKPLLGQFTDMSVMHRGPPFKMISNLEEVFTGATDKIIPHVTKSWGTHNMDYEIAKAKSKYGLEPSLSINAEKEYMKDNVAKIERYRAPSDTAEDIHQPSYDFNRAFHIDDDDVKTLSGTTLEWWPFFLHSPYEYENMKMDTEIQKAKEKRYVMGSPERIIPVHERQEDYAHVFGARHIEPQYDRGEVIRGAADNPVSGDKGFISFVLKDFTNSYDSDPLELSWRNAFDTNDNMQQNTGKRNRRLDNSHGQDQTNTGTKIDASRAALGDSNHEKGYEKKHEFDKHESGDKKSNNHNTDRTKSEAHQAAYKDVVDEFANRYGGEDHNRHSVFALKRNSDNGEKKKGFRRVYHKDEYQEDNEFYDNTNNSAKSEDSGSSIARIGGSTAAVQSHAAAAAGNKANAFNEVENTRQNNFENNHKGHDAKHGHDRDYNRYKDVAHKTADNDYTYFNIV